MHYTKKKKVCYEERNLCNNIRVIAIVIAIVDMRYCNKI